MSDSVRPHRRQPIRLPRPWDSPGKNTGIPLGCYFLLQCMKVKSESEVAQSCPTLSDSMDCSLPGSFAHRIFQARLLEWADIAFSERKMSTELCCYRIIFRVPWPAKRAKQISPGCSLETLMLKLKLEYIGHLMQRADSLEMILMLNKIEGRGRSGRQRMKWLNGITDSIDMVLSGLWKVIMNWEAWRASVHGVTKSQTYLN